MKRRRPRATASLIVAFGLGVALPSCGGAGGASTGETLSGVVLVDFIQASEDNVPLNRILEFVFSSPMDPESVGPASIQIRQGPAFGAAVQGKYVVQGTRITFEPNLPGLCDGSDSGLQPGTDYRVTVIGSPEEFALRNLAGAPLDATSIATFHTRPDSDPELYEDQIPGVAPFVIATTPADGAYPTHPSPVIAAPVFVQQGNKVRIVFSENVDPCTISEDSVRFYQYARGSAGTMPTGFSPESDQTPGDAFTWGSGTSEVPARRVRATQVLTQNFLGTTLDLEPVFGEFPDNALLVVTVTANVRDFGGNPMTLSNFGFVSENRAPQSLTRVFEFVGETPILGDITTAEVNTVRSPSKAQGWLLFAGTGDNGTVLTRASGPNGGNPLGCTTPVGIPQPDDGTADVFDPTTDVQLDTGATKNFCRNDTDGSTAVVFEYQSFRIRSGVNVRLVGVNPAIILVNGDVSIESGGRLFARGTGVGGAPNDGNGVNGVKNSGATAAGGTGLAGAGRGGSAPAGSAVAGLSENGVQGYFMQPAGVVHTSVGTPNGVGGGHGTISSWWTTQTPANRNGASGGGGGHSQAGMAGNALGSGTTPLKLDGTPDGAGGSTYGDTSGKCLTPEAGSGGGGGAHMRPFSGTAGYGAGGGGGAGGGFIDLTARGDIRIYGTLDAAGGRGGAGASGTYYTYEPGTGGGGGGSGGGIRMLTPNSIELGAGAVVTAAGGQGGVGGVAQAGAGIPVNDGGVGGAGRLVFEDDDSVITGYGGAQVFPPEGQAGFYRGIFDASRFVGGGLKPVAVTDLIDMGPFNPSFVAPVQTYGVQEDFVAGLPNVASLGLGRTGIFVEIQGYTSNADGTPNLALSTGWKSVGYFTDSGSEGFPIWNVGTPGDVTVSSDNTGGSISAANGRQFCQFRFTFFLRNGMGPFDPGHYVDRWTLPFTYDQ